MENAAKALLIAGGVLLGIMILSLGVSLYASLSSYVESSQEDIAIKEVQQFNEQFVKYININNDTGEAEFILTIQDIVSAANTAYENNLNYELTEQSGNNYYVTINMTGNPNLEKNINTISSQILSQNLGQEYKCRIQDVKINPSTGRVYEVNFYK